MSNILFSTVVLYFVLLMRKSSWIAADSCSFPTDTIRDPEHCYPSDTTSLTEIVCVPCTRDKWLDMVTDDNGKLVVKEQNFNLVGESGNCFNNDPLVVPKCHRSKNAKSLAMEMTDNIPQNNKLDPFINFAAFQINKQYFFRYPLDPTESSQSQTNSSNTITSNTSGGSGTSPSNSTATSRTNSSRIAAPRQAAPRQATPVSNSATKETMDLGLVGSFYTNSDFELLEWPGITLKAQKEKLIKITNKIYNDPLKDPRTIYCFDQFVTNHSGPCLHSLQQMKQKLNSTSNECKTCDLCELEDEYSKIYGNCTRHTNSFVTLSYARSSAKLRYYPCNSVEGTYITAMGLISPAVKAGNDTIDEPTQKLYVASGSTAITKDYIQPFLVRRSTLLEMSQDKDASLPCYRFDENGEIQLEDLRTVYDFEFTRNRLIIATKCGILLAKNVITPPLNVSTAKLWTIGTKSQQFYLPIYSVASSTCCLSNFECDQTTTIVAATDYNKAGGGGENIKYLYISYDLGDNFQTKLIGTEFTPLNLIKGMYQVYDKWASYYKFMAEENLEHIIGTLSITGERKDKLKQLPWTVMTVEEREEALAFGLENQDRFALLDKIVDASNDRHQIDTNAPTWVDKFIREKFKHVSNVSFEDCENDDDCASKQLEDDAVIKYLLSDDDNNITVKTPKHKYDSEPYCAGIVSMEVEQEQNALILLCRIGVGNLEYKYNSTEVIDQFYAMFIAYLKPNNPIVVPIRKSQRMFRCRPMIGSHDSTPSVEEFVPPDIIRVKGTSNYIIVNCKNVIYYSTNGCRTVYNAVFYYKENTKQGGDNTTTDTNNTTDFKYLRFYEYAELNVPPLAAVDPQLNYITFTFKDHYVYGAFSYNHEFRVLAGKILPHDFPRTHADSLSLSDTKGATLFVPWYTNSYRLIFAIPLIQFYRERRPYSDYYKGRFGLGLMEISHSFYTDMRPFYEENKHILAEKRNEAFHTCDTFKFSVKPTFKSLDIGETVTLAVGVVDDNRQIALSIFSSQEKSVSFSVKKSDRSSKHPRASIMHDWDIKIKAIPYYKSRENSLIDAFFGSSYQNMESYSTNLAIVNQPKIRCHVQPTGLVAIKIGCGNEVLIAHEEEYRPQCEGKFYNNFQYVLEKGHFDPEMMQYWMKRDEKKEFYISQDDESVLITYDYATFGCPLEPYRLDNFAPDLRIADTSVDNDVDESTLRRYKEEYVLIELFGATGFSYLHKVSTVKCLRKPQNLVNMIQEWKIRRHVFKTISEKLRSEEKFGEPGNTIFDIESVFFQQNIWNRANYENCQEDQFIEKMELSDEPLEDSILEEPYEIMENDDDHDGDADDEGHDDEISHVGENDNKIVWNTKEHQRVYIFLVVALDPYGTLCNLQTIFGVSLPYRHENNDLVSFLIFLLFVALWLLLCVLGYTGRRAFVKHKFLEEARVDRLEEAAWTIIYRYERIIHEQANRKKKNKLKKPTESHVPASNATVGKSKSKKETKAK